MSTMPSNRIFRALGWIFPVVIGIAGACSDANETGGTRPSGSGTTSGDATTGTGVTTGTGSGTTTATGSGTSTGTTGSGTVTGTTGAGGASGTTTGMTTTTGPATTGPGTTTGGGGTSGTGGSGAGGAPPKDGGVVVVDGGKSGDTTCGAGVTPSGIGRCSNAPKYIVAKGTALTIANFEDAGPNQDHNTIFFGDGRAGNFINLQGGGTATMTIAQTTGTAGQQSYALHYTGNYPSGVMPMFALPVADCYDSRVYRGVSFWIKGNPGAGNTQLKFQVHTPVAQPAPSGGCSAADAAAGKCDDHFAKLVPITANWTRYIIKWTDLKQNCPSNIPAGYNPAQYNEMFSFAIPKPGAGFDVWLDDFTFDTGDLPANSLADIISELTFNEMWSLANADGTFQNLRNPFYTYQGMMSAVSGFAGIATTGDTTNRRIEAAALFSNIAHETDQLGIVEEKGCENDHTCTQYGTSASGLTYHGRGPIQLTLAANYTSASSALGLGTTLVTNPELVATDATVSWKTGFWFWMGGLSGGGTTPHQAITTGQGLGATIRIINGIECGGANAAAVANRIRHFKRFSYMFGLDPGALASGC
jgi:Chitinase class I